MTLEIFGYGALQHGRVMAGVWKGENIEFVTEENGVRVFSVDGKTVAKSNLPFAILYVEPLHR